MNITENSTLNEMIKETDLIKEDVVTCETKLKELLNKNEIKYNEAGKLSSLCDSCSNICGDLEIKEGKVGECVITTEKTKTFTINTNLGYIPRVLIAQYIGGVSIDGFSCSGTTSTSVIDINVDSPEYAVVNSGFSIIDKNGDLNKIIISINNIKKNSFDITITKKFKGIDNNLISGITSYFFWTTIK